MGCGRSNSNSHVSNPVSVPDNRNISVSKEQTTYVKLQIPNIPDIPTIPKIPKILITPPNTEPQSLQRAAISVSSIVPSVTPSKAVPPAPINKKPQAVFQSASEAEVPPSSQNTPQNVFQVPVQTAPLVDSKVAPQIELEAIKPKIAEEVIPAPLTCIINYCQPKSKFRSVYCSKGHLVCRECVPLYIVRTLQKYKSPD